MITLITACAIEPSTIEYGKDACHYCKMNIVDKTHATQMVTKKGKSFKYDAIECMLNDLKGKDQQSIALFLVTDYLKPETLIDATTATYLITEAIQSPMGANLSAFADQEKTNAFITKINSGTLYTWNELQNNFYNQ